MSESKREKIVQRIRKLMAVAENRGATESEAAAAALAAQRLIAQHDIEQWELHSKESEPIVEVGSDDSPRRWRWHLAGIIAPAFRCCFYGCSEYDANIKGRRQRIYFYGYKTDATAAAITFNSLYRAGNRLARCFSKGAGHGLYNAYIAGFVLGIAEELEKQSEALMIIVPPKVSESFESEHVDLEEANTKLDIAKTSKALAAREQGFAEGRETVRSHRLEDIDATQEPSKALSLPGVS